ncbi:hypothetical protein CKO35_06610 [Ectothiorhodospira shaposhnikovii]|uniref:DUF3634 family protein n=1 Tax=Ectothiorhodospira shaposhnikovii TaxID=1054 RepID=UPI001905ADC1|nr:DUF3634 family protein [Ectothiorhodospira shaposhnikovii]MBK1672983.1 hypothetical protein [Ectothiorhodospira shaposhnikovii]
MLLTLALMLLILLLGLVLLLWHARTAFVITLEQGRARTLRGTAPPGFLRGCDEVARMYRLTQGRISGVRTAHGVQLRFSREIPEHVHQPLRNVWTPPTDGGGGGGHRAAG